MKVRELKKMMIDPVSVYLSICRSEACDDFETLYQGYLKNAPADVLDKDVHIIGVTCGKLDIQVEG